MTISYGENIEDANKKLLELINEFSEVRGKNLIYRTLWHFYTLITNYQKEKLRKQFHLQPHEKE